MYYNLTEDQKIFLETSYSMIKAGYTLEEVEEFWSSEDEDNVKNILESVDSGNWHSRLNGLFLVANQLKLRI